MVAAVVDHRELTCRCEGLASLTREHVFSVHRLLAEVVSDLQSQATLTVLELGLQSIKQVNK